MATKQPTVKHKLASPKGIFHFSTIKGEGINVEYDKTKPDNMAYQARLLFKKGSEADTTITKTITTVWEQYKKVEQTALGSVKQAFYKPFTIACPDGTIDEETGYIKRLPTDFMVLIASTSTTFKDGKPKVVGFHAKAGGATGVQNLTKGYNEADWAIGKDSEGYILGTIMGNTGGGNAKISLYLTALQITKLIKYEGDEVEVIEDDEAEVIDMGMSVGSETNTPTDDTDTVSI